MDALNRPTVGRLFIPGQIVSLFGDGLAVLAIPLLVVHLTHNPTAVALAAAPRMVGYLLAGFPAGPLVDRTDPWHVLIAADAVRAAIFLGLFGMAITGTGLVPVILALAFIAGAAGVFFETALTVVVRDIYRDRELLRTNSFLETASQASLVVGPAVVGLLAATAGSGAALLIDAVTFMVSLATLMGTYRSVPQRIRSGERRHRLRAEFRAGLRYLASSSIMSSLAVLQLITNLCLAATTLIVFFARDVFGASPGLVGVVAAGGGVGGILGAAMASTVAARYRPVPVCVLGVLLIGVALAVAGIAPGIWWLAASNAVLVWADVLASIVIRTLRQQTVPRELLGRVTSTTRSVVFAAGPVGVVLAGLLTQLDGNNPRPVFLAAAALIGVSAPVVWATGLRRHRGIPLHRSDEELVTA
ncbi:MFS transporter [Nocardia pseudovaccinii]|uniref:MFS transporter n=1 Tax=Nocardia pseudovaccinii TaxID=189540 RepID=UPI0007A4125B|nr:MFS transporter [Nocardia pseudovaccinii]